MEPRADNHVGIAFEDRSDQFVHGFRRISGIAVDHYKDVCFDAPEHRLDDKAFPAARLAIDNRARLASCFGRAIR